MTDESLAVFISSGIITAIIVGGGIVALVIIRFSKMAGQKYFGNTCPKCGVLSGEFFLHSEPGAPFFPVDEKEARSLYLTEIPLSTAISVKASLSMGVGELILSNAKKI